MLREVKQNKKITLKTTFQSHGIFCNNTLFEQPAMPPSQLQIKVNALKRLIKEKGLYEQEVSEQEQYVNQLKANNGDEYDIKKQVEVLEESQRMVPQVSAKIQQLQKSLQDYLDSYTGDEDLTEAKELLN